MKKSFSSLTSMTSMLEAQYVLELALRGEYKMYKIAKTELSRRGRDWFDHLVADRKLQDVIDRLDNN